jgi:hypothetical protein
MHAKVVPLCSTPPQLQGRPPPSPLPSLPLHAQAERMVGPQGTLPNCECRAPGHPPPSDARTLRLAPLCMFPMPPGLLYLPSDWVRGRGRGAVAQQAHPLWAVEGDVNGWWPWVVAAMEGHEDGSWT